MSSFFLFADYRTDWVFYFIYLLVFFSNPILTLTSFSYPHFLRSKGCTSWTNLFVIFTKVSHSIDGYAIQEVFDE